MRNHTEENAAPIGDVDVPENLDDEFDEESWMWIHYDRRKDAFEAVRAADLLGISCSMSNRSVPGPDESQTQEWVVELRAAGCMPVAAHSSIERVR